MMTFHHGIDTDFIVIDVREKLAMVRHLLPRETEKPIIAKFEQSDSPIMIVALSSEKLSPEQLREIAEEQIKEKIMRVSGVANIEIGGGRERKLLMNIDNAKLQPYKLPILKLSKNKFIEHLNISGEIDEASKNYVIRATENTIV